jgi:hypothetical protein
MAGDVELGRPVWTRMPGQVCLMPCCVESAAINYMENISILQGNSSARIIHKIAAD